MRGDAQEWADKIGGIVLPTGSVRLVNRAAIDELPGYAEGQWWVQDAAAALPAQLLNVRSGERVADLCAAPGGAFSPQMFSQRIPMYNSSWSFTVDLSSASCGCNVGLYASAMPAVGRSGAPALAGPVAVPCAAATSLGVRNDSVPIRRSTFPSTDGQLPVV